MTCWRTFSSRILFLCVVFLCILGSKAQNGKQAASHQSVSNTTAASSMNETQTMIDQARNGSPASQQPAQAQNGTTSPSSNNTSQQSGQAQNGTTSPSSNNASQQPAQAQNGTTSPSSNNASQQPAQAQTKNQTAQGSATAQHQLSPTSQNQNKTTQENNDGSQKSESPKGSQGLSPGIVRLLRQLSTFVPGLKDNLNAGFGLSTSQLKTINSFVQLLMDSTGTNPQTLTDIFQSLQTSGLLDSVQSVFGGSSSAMPKDAAEVCDRANRSLASPNTTLADVLNLQQPLSDDMAWANVSLQSALDWCEHNFTNSPPGYPKAPGIDIPTSHTVYEWKKCQTDINVMLQGLRQGNMWALKMLDASGKPESSILKGNLKFMGNYKECQEVSHRDTTTFSKIEGNICRAYVKPPFDLPKSFLSGGEDVRIQWDLCLPKSCLDRDINYEILQRKLYDRVWMTCTKDLDISDDGTAIMAIAILSLFGLLLVAGTITEFCVSHSKPGHKYKEGNGHVANGHAHVNKGFDHNEVMKDHVTSFTEPNGKPSMVEMKAHENQLYAEMNGHHRGNDTKNGIEVTGIKETVYQPQTAPLKRWQKALLAFSVPRNTEKILSVKSAPGTIGCLHGIRVLSMGWVILGHTLISFGIYENPADIFGLINTFSFQMILNAPLSVDTFFVMSGCLTCYLFMKTLGKKGKVTGKDMLLYYVHRYWRLTPSLLIFIMFVACLLKYVGEGRPAWGDYPAAEICRKNWWINMLYINNVYKQDEACVGVTWFLAHDMQFYIVAPLVMVPWVYGQRFLGFLNAVGYIAIHVSSTIWLEIKYNADLLRHQNDYSPEIYFKPYTRVAPFAIGLILGWVLWKTKCKVRMNKCAVFMGWIVCLGIILTLNFVTYDENRDIPTSDWTKTGRVVFESFYRPTWALAISWLIFACATGYGGYINSILSWGGWLPLSRLTYSAYLIHLTILGFNTMTPEKTMLFTLTSLSYYFLGTFVLAYAVGYLLTITVESPMLALEKVVLG